MEGTFTIILPHTLPEILNNLKILNIPILSFCLILTVLDGFTQDQQTRIDSLVNHLKSAGREWGNYAEPLIEIGESAVPPLIELAENRNLGQWNRRVAIMTLNEIKSPQWKEPALSLLFDRSEVLTLRNQVTIGLKGFELSDVKQDLWEVYQELENGFQKLNLAGLLMTADTAMAYRSFHELYINHGGYIKNTALLNLTRIRPEESGTWFMDGLQTGDWLTANMSMDSLVAARDFFPDELISLYHKPGLSEDIQWRIAYIFGHRNEPESVPYLVEMLKEESWLVHTEAAIGLCRFQPDRVIPEMKALKRDPRTYIRKNSRWVICRIKDPRFRDSITEKRND